MGKGKVRLVWGRLGFGQKLWCQKKKNYIDGTAEFVFLVEWDTSATASF